MIITIYVANCLGYLSMQCGILIFKETCSPFASQIEVAYDLAFLIEGEAHLFESALSDD